MHTKLNKLVRIPCCIMTWIPELKINWQYNRKCMDVRILSITTMLTNRQQIKSLQFMLQYIQYFCINQEIIYQIITVCMSRDNVVGIATGYGLDNGGVGVRVPVGPRIFFSPLRPDWLWGPPSFLSMDTGGSFPGGKAAGPWSWPLISN
jgi:hypothetical protein